MKTIKIKYHSDIVKPLFQAHEGEWIDLKTAETVDIKQGEWKLISLGVSIEIPEGYESIIAPRSSTFKNYGILMTNSIGIIDNKYCGDNDIWKMSCYGTKDIVIPAGTRLCQFRIQPIQEPIEFIEVNTLGNEDRGGFGSTGKV